MDLSVAFYISFAVLWILVVFHSLVLLGVVQVVNRIQTDSHPTDEGSDMRGRPAPDFSATDLRGERFDARTLNGRARALLFVSTDCRSCAATLDELRALMSKVQGALAIICRGGQDQCLALAERYDFDVPIVADTDLLISRLYSVDQVPMAVLISADDKIQSYGAPLREDLEAIAEAVTVGKP